MAYQSVGTPRFWVSTLQWLNSKGLVEERGDNVNERLRLPDGNPIPRSIFNVNPTSAIEFQPIQQTGNYFNFNININLNSVINKENNFLMYLGHNMRTKNIEKVILKNMQNTNPNARNSYINGTDVMDQADIQYDGFSINIGNDGDELTDTMKFVVEGSVAANFTIGSILYGNYYTMPHSPDLNLTMTREYGGTKTMETRGGATLSNSYWTKQPNWANGLPAWQLSDSTEPLASLSSSGRRVWDLSFSYLDKENLFPEDLSLRNTNVNPMEQEFLSNNSNANFFSDVIHKSVGLPFVFQPDNTDTTNFAICMFDQDSFQFKQVANGVYNISMKIREVW